MKNDMNHGPFLVLSFTYSSCFGLHVFGLSPNMEFSFSLTSNSVKLQFMELFKLNKGKSTVT